MSDHDQAPGPALGLDDASYARARAIVLALVKVLADQGLGAEAIEAMVTTAQSSHDRTRAQVTNARNDTARGVDFGHVAALEAQADALDLELGMFRGALKFAKAVEAAKLKAIALQGTGTPYSVGVDPRRGDPRRNGKGAE